MTGSSINQSGVFRPISFAPHNRFSQRVETNRRSFIAKRALDIAVGGASLMCLMPLFALIALGIKLQDGGPVFFRQKRVGKGGASFTMYKFRSMRTNADRLKRQLAEQNQHGANGVTFKIKRDPRITPLGRIIRKASLDELPQLWNVIKGDMSLVGPRPAVPAEVEQYTPQQRGRLNATPGMTCIWQVRGRAEIPFEQQVQLDLEYIRTQSLWLDVKLMFQTVPAVLTARGAY